MPVAWQGEAQGALNLGRRLQSCVDDSVRAEGEDGSWEPSPSPLGCRVVGGPALCALWSHGVGWGNETLA